MRGPGHQIFADVLARRAAVAPNPMDLRLTRIADAVVAPLRVAVRGRRGVGRETVGSALAAAGLVTVDDGADLDVLVVAEVAKPEDVRDVAAGRGTTLVVLNKADLSGFAPGGPIAAAQRDCPRLAALTGAPTEPLVALLAVAALDSSVLDDELIAALRALVDEPADLRSPDEFVDGPHRLPRSVRQRLVDSLDLFGIAHATVTLRQSPDARPEALRAVLRRASRIDQVITRLEDLAAEVRYQRVRSAVAELEILAITDPEMAALLAADETVLACMSAAVDVVEAGGLTVDPADEAAAHLSRALHWRRYAAGPVAAVHQACAADIARGSLRLLAAQQNGLS